MTSKQLFLSAPSLLHSLQHLVAFVDAGKLPSSSPSTTLLHSSARPTALLQHTSPSSSRTPIALGDLLVSPALSRAR
jgi:hypothetical protein